MSKKVIEQENTKSGVAICHFDKIITLHSGQDLSENHSVFVINKDEATTVAKAIDERYQKIEDLLDEARILIHVLSFDDPDLCDPAKKDIAKFYSKIEELKIL